MEQGVNVYPKFLLELDSKLEKYFKNQAEYICCKKGCSACCEKGDYPISELELRYIMLGYSEVDSETKLKIQQNLSTLEKGGKCPFLISSECSIYPYRPIICRVHGLAYICDNGIVKLPYCANDGRNFASVYNDEIFTSEPIREDLNTPNLLKDLEYGEIRNLYDWIKNPT